MWIWLLAAPAADPSAFNLTSLGVFSIVAVLLLAVVRYLLAQGVKKDQQIEALTQRLDSLQQARIADRDSQMERDRERSERVVALLQQTASVLEAAPRQFERALGTAREASSRGEVEDMVRRVKEMTAEVERRWNPGPAPT